MQEKWYSAGRGVGGGGGTLYFLNLYCKFGNDCENLVLLKIQEFDALQI